MEIGRWAAGGPDMMQIRLLGGFQVSIGARVIEEGEWRLRRAAMLLKLLSLAPGHRLLRDQVLDVLWPDDDPKAAANRLHHALHVARRMLGSASGHLRLEGDALSLGPPEAVWIDVDAFEHALSAARRGHELTAYRSALSLYAGDLLPGDLYDDWAAPRREGLRHSYLAALGELAGLYEAKGDIGQAVEALQQAVKHEPAHEESHAGLMRLYARVGQRYAALRQYEQLQHALQTELDAEPDDATQRLHAQILDGVVPGPPAAPPAETAQSSDERRHNLPTALTSFIGREAEMAEAQRLLQTTRLLTLQGPGGAGKTRLALEVAGSSLEEYRDGVWMVELAPVAEGDLVSQLVAETLSVPEEPGTPRAATLAEALRSRHLLLVLDNCEHLIDACAALAELLLSACPEIRILATSREILDVPGEVTGTVPPLSRLDIGSPDMTDDPDEMLKFDAIRLFVDRARNRNQSFELTKQTGPAVAQICARVDGIPLAIELAAARVGALSVEQIALRLDDCMSLLTIGGRTREPRQQTLRAALDWSYDLLSEPEQAMFRRLSVFAGGWTLESAEALGPGRDTLDLLSRLVDKSLVSAESQADGSVRYRLLEPIRQYAQSRLIERGEERAAHVAHAALFLALARHSDGQLRGPEQGLWLSRFETEHDNLRAALEWCRDAGEGEQGLRLVGHIWTFWYSRGHFREGREWLQIMLEASADRLSEERASGLRGLGSLLYAQRHYKEARRFIEAALVMSRDLGNEMLIATLIGNLATVITEQGDLDEAWTLHQEALARRRALGDDLGVATTLGNLGALAYRRSDYAQARDYFEQSLAANRVVEDIGSSLIALNNLGSTLIAQGDWSSALPHFLEGLKIAHELGEREITLSCLGGLGEVASGQKQLERAVLLDAASEAMREAIGQTLHPDDQERQDRYRIELRSDVGDAFERLWQEGKAMTPARAVEYALAMEEPASSTPEPTGQKSTAGVVSRREREVVALIARGLTNRQIAEELTIAERTADTHVSNILSKLGLTSRAQIAAWAVTNGLVAVEAR
jgi:predicted ATPase/DNA-binding SARP family transcriptional activator/DNA-binding CsgD family transcriptional regulator